jgi:hypothetical protein
MRWLPRQNRCAAIFFMILIDAYKNADQWKDFAKILPIEEKE